MYNCTNCNSPCNKLCPNYIISTAITVVTVDGTDTLVIDIPASTYMNGCTYCIITAQVIPATATVNMPVAISIGGDTTTVYPLICSKTGLQAVACQVNTRSRYKVCVSTNAVSGVFKALCGLGSCFTNTLASLPIVATAAPTVATASVVETPIEPIAPMVASIAPNTTSVTKTTTTTTVSNKTTGGEAL